MPATAVGDRSHRDGPVASHRDRISREADVRCGIGDPVARGRLRSRQAGPRHRMTRTRWSGRHRKPCRCERSVRVPGAPASAAERCHTGRADRGIRPGSRPARCHWIRSVMPWPHCCAGSPRNSLWPRNPAAHPASLQPQRPGHQVGAVPVVCRVAGGRGSSQGPGRGIPVQCGRAAVDGTQQFEYRTVFWPSSTSCWSLV